MAKRYIGDAVVRIQYNDDHTYSGRVSVGGRVWPFRDLKPPQIRTQGDGFGRGYDAPDAYDEMAASAVAFGSYYTTHNRGDDTPDWAPAPEVADAIDAAVSCVLDDQGRYAVRRSPNGPERFRG